MAQDSDGCRINRWELLKQKLQNLSPEAFREAIKEKDIMLIDCRKHEEYAEGYLPGAMNLDYLSYEFLDELEQLDTEQVYYVYCRSGRRSIRTCTLMQNSGFSHVFNLDGGLNAWDAQLGQPKLESTT